MQKKFLRTPRPPSTAAIIGAIIGFTLICTTISLALLWPHPHLIAASCSGSGITGVAFRDYNYNGQRDAGEPGITGVLVSAFSSDGSTASCESKADGSYGIDPAGGYPVRLEFALPAGVTYLQPGVVGTDVKTTVTFVNGPSSNIHVGFSNPGQFCGKNPTPEMATTCMVFGDQAGTNKDLPSLYSFPYTAGSTDLANVNAVSAPAPTTQALAKQVGTVWGLAWNTREQALYIATYLKRHAGFGPNGPGAIYKLSGGTLSLYHDFGALLGSDPHPTSTDTCTAPGHNPNNDNFNCWLHDRKPSDATSQSFDLISKMAFGDIDFSEDSRTLYAVNLANRTLMLIPVGNPAAFSSVAIPTPSNCPAADVRPFGLGVNDGKLYLGMVCSAESSKNTANLRAYVYSFDGTTFSSSPLLDFPMQGRRSASFAWEYWINQSSFTSSTSKQTPHSKWAQPILSDITFDGNDLILAFRDRNGDQIGVVAGGPDPNDSKSYTGIARGDILRACSNGSGWTLESGGKCNGKGAGGNEYYPGDSHPTDDETALGSVAQVPGLPDVVSTVFNPIFNVNEVSDGGIKWLNNTTGAATRSYRLYNGTSEVARFDKASGMGDLEALCPLAPLEIGNRVWLDTNNDGIQGADEAGIDGVKVDLYRNGSLVGSTTTANGGQYYFTSIDPATGTPGGDSAYEIRIAGVAAQAPLTSLVTTLANQGSADQRDSDGTVAGADVVYRIPYADLAGAGYNNHTYDFGFFQPTATATDTPTQTPTQTPTDTPTGTLTPLPTDTPTATPTDTPTGTLTPLPTDTPTATPTQTPTGTLTPNPTVTPTNTPTATPTNTPTQTATPRPLLAAIGDFVWEDLDKDGLQDKDEPPVPGITVKLRNESGTVISTTVTDANGKYLFDFLPAGNYSLEFSLPNGYRVTQNDVNGVIQDQEDSDTNPVTLTTILTTLDPGERDMTWDMGIFRIGTNSPDDPEPADMTQTVFLPYLRK